MNSDNKEKFINSKKSGALYELKKDPNNPNEELEFRLIERKQVTHDSFIFTFELPDDLNLGLNLGQHIAIE